MITNIIIVLIIIAIIGIAVRKMYVDKKNGVKCSGCPDAKACKCDD